MTEKLPLPLINIKDVMPDNELEKKCGPHLNFENGSCIPLSLLIRMAEAFNEYNKSNNDDEKIVLNSQMDTLQPDNYKKYLLFEFKKRYSNSQSEWIKQEFTKNMSENDKEDLEYNTFRPTGPSGKFDWLSTIDINKTLDQYEKKYEDFKFFGAVPIDFNELEYYPFKKLNFDDLHVKEKKKRIGVIFNLDEHHQSGSHWVSLFADLEKGQIYFSDSYGTRPEKRIRDFMTRIEEYIKKKNIPDIDVRHNKTQHQKGNSECGVYSINFILRLLKGKTFDHITRKRVTDEAVNKCRKVYFSNNK